MCGIIGAISFKKNIKNILIDGLKNLENRGYDSCGIFLNNKENNCIKKIKKNKISPIKNLEIDIKNIEDSNLGIAHTRWATHGKINYQNSHPHISYDKKLFLVHNGTIENFLEIKNFLIKKNIIFQTETDSEVILNLICYNNNKNKKLGLIYAIKKSLKNIIGTYAIILSNLDEENKLYCFRSGSPMLISKNDDLVIITSEKSGFSNLVRNYFILENDDISIIKLKKK